MSTAMKVSTPQVALREPRRAEAKAILLWVAALLLIIVVVGAATLAVTLGGTERTMPPAPSQDALQRHHAEAYEPAGFTAEAAERQAALQRMKEEGAATSSPPSTTYDEAFKRLKAGY